MNDAEEFEIEVMAVTDHAEACAELLEGVVNKLLTGTCPEDIGRVVTLIGRMMERKT